MGQKQFDITRKKWGVGGGVPPQIKKQFYRNCTKRGRGVSAPVQGCYRGSGIIAAYPVSGVRRSVRFPMHVQAAVAISI